MPLSTLREDQFTSQGVHERRPRANEPGPRGLEGPNCSGRKHSSHGASRVLEQEAGSGGEGLVLQAREQPDRGRSPLSRHVTSWQGRRDPLGVSCPLLERVKSRSPSFTAADLGLNCPTRSICSCKKRRRFARSRAEAFRTCSSRAAVAVEGGRPKHRPSGRSGPFRILVQGLRWGPLHPHSRPELGSCSCDVQFVHRQGS